MTPKLHFPQAGLAGDARATKRARHFENLPVLTHGGRRVLFYDDLVRGRRVLIHAMYTACQGVCSPATQNLLAARRLLGDAARGLHIVSLTLTPVSDDPQALQAYRQTQGIDGDWTLVTGLPRHVEAVGRGLGFLPRDGRQAALSDHSGSALVGDEAAVRWGHVSTLQSPRAIARMIRFELGLGLGLGRATA